MNLALLVIDLQKCFVNQYPDRAQVDRAAAVINYTAGMLRKAGHLIVHVQDVEDAEFYSEEEIGFIDEIEVEDSDVVIQKEYSNAFWETELASTLREKSVDLLILSGQAAEHCVVFTYNGAIENDFRPVILQDGVASSKPGRAEALQQDRNVVSHSVIEALTTS